MIAKHASSILLTFLFASAIGANASGHTSVNQAAGAEDDVLIVAVPDGKLAEAELRDILRQITRALVLLRAENMRVKSMVSDHWQEFADYRESTDYDRDALATIDNAVSDLGGQLALTRLALQSLKTEADIRFEHLQTIDAGIKSEIGVIDQSVGGQSARLDELENHVARVDSLLEQQSQHVDRSFQEVAGAVANVESAVEQQYASVSSDIIRRSLIGLGAIFALLLIGLLAARRLNSARHSTAKEVNESIGQVQEEQNRLDLRLSEFLTQKVVDAPSGEADHSFFLTVADEINRMRKRITRMPSDTKGIKPLEKALERLESGLQIQGYEVVNLLAEKYVEGLNVTPRFMPDEQLAPGEQVITNIIKPQVNYRGRIVQVAEVEVGIGE